LCALFNRQPGAGKTMAALMLARALSCLPVRIDLPRIASNSIGETEKRLG
jgi:SpoVK/Ycf46/Vps4 family AAA+-type ATPase